MDKRVALVAVGIAMALSVTSCGGSSDGKKADGAKTAKPSACGKDDGKGGVVRSFCEGPAVVKFTIDGRSGTVKGGECANSGGYFNLNAGTVVSPEFVGDKPDYVGILLPTSNGSFSEEDVTASITTGGETTVIIHATGSHDETSAHIKGNAQTDGSRVTVDFTC